MKELTINQLEVIEGGGFWGGFCTTVAILDAAGAAAALAGATLATGGAAGIAAGVWVGANLACGIAGVHHMVTT
ncbi:MAG TPA: hypothetical protein VJ953_04355 [Saprospiraceae bacterium]|nr:hypothetical protein [Saprospiraceae bacterium]